jgi:energy-coupling factor transport system permease protein
MMTFQFHEGKSFLHNIEPIPKMIWLICISIINFLYQEPLPLLVILFLVLVIGIGLARIKLGFLIKGIRLMFLFSLGFFVLQLIFISGETVLLSVGSFPITLEAVNTASTVVMRILIVFTSSLIFVVTTDPRDLVTSLTQKLKVPYRFAYSLFIALRFIPTLEEEARIIRSAHAVRGVGRQKGIKNRLGNFKKFSMPLLMGSIRKVRTIANTMDAKGYGAYHDRTYIRKVPVTIKGSTFALVWIVFTAMIVIIQPTL